MGYKLKYSELSEEDTEKILKMHIGNHDDATQADKWIANARARIDTDLELTENAIDLFLKHGNE